MHTNWQNVFIAARSFGGALYDAHCSIAVTLQVAVTLPVTKTIRLSKPEQVIIVHTPDNKRCTYRVTQIWHPLCIKFLDRFDF